MKSKKNIVVDEVSKKIFFFEEDNIICQIYTDHIQLNKNEVSINGLGEKLKIINAFFLDYLNAYNVPTGYKSLSDEGIIFQKHNRYPFCIKIQNNVDRNNAKIFGLKEGNPLQTSIMEILYNSVHNITDSHILAFDICPFEDIKIIRRICSKVNVVLKSFFERRNLALSEVCCYFGNDENKIFLVDDFTPLSIKLKPVSNGLFKDPYKNKSAQDISAYTEFFLNLIKS